MTNVVPKSEEMKQYCFHLRGVPAYWTETDLLDGLFAAGVKDVETLQVLTKTVTHANGEMLVIPNGDAIIVLREVMGLKLMEDLVESRSAKLPEGNIHVHVRRLLLPTLARDLPPAVRANLSFLYPADAQRPFEELLEEHQVNIGTREVTLWRNCKLHQRDRNQQGKQTFEETLSSILKKSERITLGLGNREKYIREGLRRRRRTPKEFVISHYDNGVPCFRFADSGKGIAFPAQEASSVSTEEVSGNETMDDPSDLMSFVVIDNLHPYSISTSAQVSSRERLDDDPYYFGSSTLKFEKVADKVTAAAMQNSVLYVDGLSCLMDAVETGRFFEQELGGSVAFSIRFKAKVVAKKPGARGFRYDLPQRDGAIIFEDAATEAKCLERTSFECYYPPSRGSTNPRILTVSRMECKVKIAAVFKEINARATLLEVMHPSVVSSFDRERQSVVSAGHKELVSEFRKVQSLQKEGYVVQKMQLDILDSPSVWMHIWKNSLCYGFAVPKDSLMIDPGDNSFIPQQPPPCNYTSTLPLILEVEHPSLEGFEEPSWDSSNQSVSAEPVPCCSKSLPPCIPLTSSNATLVDFPASVGDPQVQDSPTGDLPAPGPSVGDPPAQDSPERELPAIGIAAALAPPPLPLVADDINPRFINEATVPLLVQGIYFHWDACTLTQYFEKELDYRVKFCALYSKTLQRIGEGIRGTTYKIPQGEAIIVFRTLASEAACLERGMLYPEGIPRQNNGDRRFLRVTRINGPVSIAAATRAMLLREGVTAGMTEAEYAQFSIRYRNMVFDNHYAMLMTQWRYNKLREEEEARFFVTNRCILELYTDWWNEQLQARNNNE